MEKWEINVPKKDQEKDLKIAQLEQDKASMSEIITDLLMWKIENGG